MSRPRKDRRRVLERPVPGAPPLPRAPHPVRSTLANGLRVVVVPLPTLPHVALRVVLPAGSAADPRESDGLAALTGTLLTEGTRALSGEALNQRLDLMGASVSAQVGQDFAEVDFLSLSENLGEGIGLLADILSQPSFPQPELERVRAETVEALEARLDEPGNVADDALGEALFGLDHPYGRLPLGTIETVEGLTRDAVSAFHQRHYLPHGAVLIAAGDVEPQRLCDLLEASLTDWTGIAARPDYPNEPPADPQSQRLLLPWEDARQSEIRIGGPGMERSSADWIPAALANYLLGGSTITGRLGANLREDKGWTYGVRSGFSASVQPGGWGIETAVDSEVTAAAIDEIMMELTRFLAEPVSDEELRRGKDALILSLPRAFETPGRIVSRMATLEAFGLPEDYWQQFPDRLEAVSRDDLLRIAHRYFDPARLVAVAVGAEP